MHLPAPCTPQWVAVGAVVPPIDEEVTGRSPLLLVATDEAAGGQTFAYFVRDDQEGRWVTSCASQFELGRVTHFALPPHLPGTPIALSTC